MSKIFGAKGEAAPVASEADVLVQEGHQDPPGAAHPGLRPENSVVPDKAYREAMKPGDRAFITALGGAGAVIEADETYIGRKSENKAFKKPVEKMAVVSLVERNGCVRSFHVPRVTSANVAPILARHANPDSRFMTDESPLYRRIGWNFKEHGTVNHTAQEYVIGKGPAAISTNTVEGCFSILKRGINGTFHHVSEAHLHRYLADLISATRTA